MTKVNLLPDYIWEGKRRTQTVIAVLAVLLLEILAVLFFIMQTKAQIEEAEIARADAEQRAGEVDRIRAEASTIEAQIQPIVQKTQFIEGILQYNRRFPSLFERTNLYTYNRVGYRQLQPAQTVLNMTAYARNVSDIGRYLMNIQRAKDTFTTVSITSQMPGWPSTGTDTGTTTSAPTSFGAPPGYGPSATPSGYGGAPPGYGGPTPGVGAAVSVTGAPGMPRMIDFTAVGQLTEKFQFIPPVYAAAGGAEGGDPSAAGYGAVPGAPPGYGPAGAAPPPPGYGPGGGNGP